MLTLVLVIHGLITLALIAVVLVQRSEGGGLGIGGGGGGGGLMSSRGAANLLTRTTAILATMFFATSILLAVLSGIGNQPSSILDTDNAPGTSQPAQPTGPSVPTSE